MPESSNHVINYLTSDQNVRNHFINFGRFLINQAAKLIGFQEIGNYDYYYPSGISKPLSKPA